MCFTPTIELVKDVQGRADVHGQFNLTIAETADPEDPFVEVTTAGDTLGVQDQQIYPTIVRAGGEYVLSESMAPGSKSDLRKYDTKFTCRATYLDGSSESIFDDVSLTNTNDRASFTITIPDGSPAIKCTFVNTPKAAGIKVDKYWVINGGTLVPDSEAPEGA